MWKGYKNLETSNTFGGVKSVEYADTPSSILCNQYPTLTLPVNCGVQVNTSQHQTTGRHTVVRLGGVS